MAEHAAHVTATSLTIRPSIFEILAQDGLNRIIQPAVKHAARVVAEQNAEKYGWILKYFDEIYAGLDFFIENYYLYKHSGSFAENFYGLRRVGQPAVHRLSTNVHWKSVFFLIAFPYIKEKWKKSYEEFRENILKFPSDQKTIKLHRWKKVGLKLFPYVNSLWEALVLYFEMSYIFHRTDWASPSLYLAGAKLTTISPEMEFLPSAKSLPTINLLPSLFCFSSFCRQLTNFCLEILNLISFGFSTSLSVGVFFLQFLDYWYNTLHSNNSPIALTLQPIPKRPKPHPLPTGCSVLTCPICKKTRTNDTVLCVSGFVFCYPCIFDHVRTHHCCPVTKYPAKVQHLVRIFASES